LVALIIIFADPIRHSEEERFLYHEVKRIAQGWLYRPWKSRKSGESQGILKVRKSLGKVRENDRKFKKSGKIKQKEKMKIMCKTCAVQPQNFQGKEISPPASLASITV